MSLVDTILDILGLPDNPNETSSDPCQDQACADARNNVAKARRQFNGICSLLKLLSMVMKALRTIISTPPWVIAALLVIAAITLPPIQYVILGVVAGYILAWVLIPLLSKVAAGYAKELQKALTRLNDAIAEVLRVCPANCRGDISVPNCRP